MMTQFQYLVSGYLQEEMLQKDIGISWCPFYNLITTVL